MAKGIDGAVGRVARRRRWDEAGGRVVVEAWRGSGEALSAFARRHGIQPQRLSRWAERLEVAESPVRFHPVRLVQRVEEDRRSERPIEIVFVDGRLVRVPPGFAAEDLERTLSVLTPRAGC